jgi:hypothetical protein
MIYIKYENISTTIQPCTQKIRNTQPMILYYHSFYYVHFLRVSIQLDHHQAIFHEMYYSLLNYISMYI